jgi:hypothetical protein
MGLNPFCGPPLRRKEITVKRSFVAAYEAFVGRRISSPQASQPFIFHVHVRIVGWLAVPKRLRLISRANTRPSGCRINQRYGTALVGRFYTD